MDQTQPGRGTFVVQITDAQNAEWQGTITHIESGMGGPFQSILELLTRIDSVVGTEKPHTL